MGAFGGPLQSNQGFYPNKLFRPDSFGMPGGNAFGAGMNN
jgi:hypothetical protein